MLEGRVFAHQRLRDDLRLVVERGDQSEECPVVFDALPDSKHIVDGCDHLIVDMDTTPHGNTRLFRQCHVGADANRHNEQIAGQFGTVLEHQRSDMAFAAKNFFGIGTAENSDALALQRLAEQVACGFVQLALHQVAHDVNHGDVHAARSHTRGGFQTQKTTTNHDDLLSRVQRHHPLGVFEIAVGDDTFQIMSRQGDHERI